MFGLQNIFAGGPWKRTISERNINAFQNLDHSKGVGGILCGSEDTIIFADNYNFCYYVKGHGYALPMPNFALYL